MIIYPDLCHLCACLEFMETYGNPKFHGSSSLSPCICYDHELWYPPKSQQPNILIAQSHVEPKQVCLKTGTPQNTSNFDQPLYFDDFWWSKIIKIQGLFTTRPCLRSFRYWSTSMLIPAPKMVSQNFTKRYAVTRWPDCVRIFHDFPKHFNIFQCFITYFYISKRHLFWICLALK